ncbi:MAG: TIR domain-containing protein [Lewinellaceae bacterium]|nr:TIR domain-containing protein [Lewinellaceae bacterium]
MEEGFALRPLSVQPQTVKPEIFISYAWGKESDTIADKLYHNLKEKGYNPILDRMELNYTGKISEFMQRIGASHYIIPVISKNYLQSRNCMYEVLQMEKHAKLHDRIFPIVLEDAQLYEDGKRGEYVNYWYEEMQKLDAEIKRFPTMAYKNSFVEELSLYSDIHRMIGDFMNLIKNMNNLTTQIHEESGFRQLMLEIDKRIATELHHGNP